MFIYNLYPLLAGPLNDWKQHLLRAANMGFEWVYINPIHVPNESGCIYSIADYFHINPILLNSDDSRSGENQFRAIADYAKKLGLQMMADLVINHCAADSPLTIDHPEWFMRNPDGSLVHPHILDKDTEIVWDDIVRFAHTEHSYSRGLYPYIIDIAEYLFSLGFNGFRCDMANHLPDSFWRRFISNIKQHHKDCIFLAETLNCPIEQLKQTASAGFDVVYNSAKWWDYEGAWLLQEHDCIPDSVTTMSFPETHDTERLYDGSAWAVNLVKQRCMFTAFFSGAWLIPLGFEFGFTKRLCVETTRPTDWEVANIDITDFISQLIAMKKSHTVLNEEGPVRILQNQNRNILILWKSDRSATEEALLILNKDIRNPQFFETNNLGTYVHSVKKLEMISSEFFRRDVPLGHFTGEIGPGGSLVFVGKCTDQ